MRKFFGILAFVAVAFGFTACEQNNLDENGKIATKAESNQMALKLDTWESEFETPKVFIDKIEKILGEENK